MAIKGYLCFRPMIKGSALVFLFSYGFASIFQTSIQRQCKLHWQNIRNRRWPCLCPQKGVLHLYSLQLMPAHLQVRNKLGTNWFPFWELAFVLTFCLMNESYLEKKIYIWNTYLLSLWRKLYELQLFFFAFKNIFHLLKIAVSQYFVCFNKSLKWNRMYICHLFYWSRMFLTMCTEDISTVTLIRIDFINVEGFCVAELRFHTHLFG